jgi:hypothetical protein
MRSAIRPIGSDEKLRSLNLSEDEADKSRLIAEIDIP